MCWLCFVFFWKASRLCNGIICMRIVMTVERERKGWILRPTVSWHGIFVLSFLFSFFHFFVCLLVSLIYIILVTLCPRQVGHKALRPSLKSKLFSVESHSKLWFSLTGWLVWNVLITRYVCEKSLYYWLLKAGSLDNTLSSWMLTGLAAMRPEMFWSFL